MVKKYNIVRVGLFEDILETSWKLLPCKNWV